MVLRSTCGASLREPSALCAHHGTHLRNSHLRLQPPQPLPLCQTNTDAKLTTLLQRTLSISPQNSEEHPSTEGTPPLTATREAKVARTLCNANTAPCNTMSELRRSLTRRPLPNVGNILCTPRASPMSTRQVQLRDLQQATTSRNTYKISSQEPRTHTTRVTNNNRDVQGHESPYTSSNAERFPILLHFDRYLRKQRPYRLVPLPPCASIALALAMRQKPTFRHTSGNSFPH